MRMLLRMLRTSLSTPKHRPVHNPPLFANHQPPTPHRQVSNLIVTPEVVLELERDGQLSPQLEISVALLVTMLCWRGIAARMRMKSD